MMQNRDYYFQQLDSLRAISVALVIFFHWFPENKGINIIATGPLGVTMFFVLSGFLITTNLLKSRIALKTNGFWTIYRKFIFKRLLRIFPLYYLVLLVVWIAQFSTYIPKIDTQFYSYPFFYIFYASNVLIEKLHNWSDLLSPYWSLAVEEQFYIFWPLPILITPKKYLGFLVWGFIISAFGFRIFFSSLNLHEGVLMPSSLDSFAFGALWALSLFYKRSNTEFLTAISILVIPMGILFVFFSLEDSVSFFKLIFFKSSMSIFCLYFVVRATTGKGFKYLIGTILNNLVLQYIGKISYGIYIYHMLVPAVLMPFLVKTINRFFSISLTLSDSSAKVTSLFILIMLSSASWILFESPINQLKYKIGFQPAPEGTKSKSTLIST
ncbi:acyltransferase family protein [Dyadobacter subterraneus]|uniref:Acyltransferase n=1 Tax=Dyadobacter subterraneus TaxID=2773304 RepID=A0ABR9WMP1_9BACT|nr:acyltransferase [Dyadobacter subterraneus]MBE9466653.1 acyltransferase [Dyadobacter subterraneus]